MHSTRKSRHHHGWLNIISAVNETASLGSALITGAAVRVGAEITRRLHHDGFNVIVHYNRSANSAESLIDELNQTRAGSATAIQQELNTADAADSLIEQITGITNDLALIVNNAAIFRPSSLADKALNGWDDLFHLNAKIPYQLALAGASALAKNAGAVINIVDIHIEHPRADYAVYDASKAALASLTRSLALELAPHVRANAIAPGAILWADDENERDRQKIIDAVPLGRVGQPQDIADAVSYLAQAKYVTGQIVNVDGGRSLTI